MSEELTRIEVNVTTGEQKIIPLTAEEIQQRELDAIAAQDAQAQREADEALLAGLKASAKAKLIAGQPLTEAEASTLII